MRYTDGRFRLETHKADVDHRPCRRCMGEIPAHTSYIRLRPGGQWFCSVKCAWDYYNVPF